MRTHARTHASFELRASKKRTPIYDKATTTTGRPPDNICSIYSTPTLWPLSFFSPSLSGKADTLRHQNRFESQLTGKGRKRLATGKRCFLSWEGMKDTPAAGQKERVVHGLHDHDPLPKIK